MAYAGVGLVDSLVRTGAFSFVKLPVTPGIEVSGIVRAVGEGVDGFKVGQRVAALLNDFTDGGMGGYAEVARAKAALTVGLADNDDLATAAATVVNGATAFLAMAGTAPGATVAISGASGGLGQSLVAAAAHCGARQIIAVSGNFDRETTLKRLGASTVLASQAFAAGHEGIDAAFDTVGGQTRLQMMRRLRPSGRLVLLGNASGDDASLSGDEIWLRSLKVEGVSTGALASLTPGRIADAAQAAIRDARHRPVAFATLDLDQAITAHRMLEARQGPGKLVLRVG